MKVKFLKDLSISRLEEQVVEVHEGDIYEAVKINEDNFMIKIPCEIIVQAHKSRIGKIIEIVDDTRED